MLQLLRKIVQLYCAGQLKGTADPNGLEEHHRTGLSSPDPLTFQAVGDICLHLLINIGHCADVYPTSGVGIPGVRLMLYLDRGGRKFLLSLEPPC